MTFNATWMVVHAKESDSGAGAPRKCSGRNQLNKALFALPLMAAVLIAAKPATPAVPPMPSIVAPAEIAANKANHLFIELSTGGTVEVVLRPDLAPHHVERIQTLVRQGFYNGLTFHRVVPGFMAQGGDPKGTGEGGSSLPDLKAEFTPVPFLRGTFGAARTNKPDSANSQFFIMFAPHPELDNNYTVMGRVVAGMDAVDAIAPGEPPAQPTKIVRAYLGG
jgi:peptidylprolyl isomerase